MTPTQQKIVDLVRSYVGVSMDCEPALLGQLMARNVDDPHTVYDDLTNCGTTALGFLWLLGVDHPLVRTKYVMGKAPEWLLRIGRDLGILHAYKSDPSVLEPGMLLYYCIPPANEHFEWLCSELNEQDAALHAGGGRPRNAITEETGNVLVSHGRPLLCYLDVPAALEDT